MERINQPCDCGNENASWRGNLRRQYLCDDCFYEFFAEQLQKLIDAGIEYETEHTDAGRNYADLLLDGDWDYYNGDKRLEAFCAENGIDLGEIEIEELATAILSQRLKPEPGNARHNASSRFLIASFPVGEVATQIGAAQFSEADFTDEELERFFNLACEDNQFRLRKQGDTLLAYESTDAVWYFYAGADQIREIVAKLNAS